MVARLSLGRAHRSDGAGFGREFRHRGRGRPHRAGGCAGADRGRRAAAEHQCHRERATLEILASRVRGRLGRFRRRQRRQWRQQCRRWRRRRANAVYGGSERELSARFLGKSASADPRRGLFRARQPLRPRGGRAQHPGHRRGYLFSGARGPGSPARRPGESDELGTNLEAHSGSLQQWHRGRAPENLAVRGGSLYRLGIPRVSPGLPSELLTQRPDIREAELKLASADANVYAARAAFLPSIQLTGQAGFESAALRTLFGPGAVFYTVAASLTQPIFQGGLLLGQLDLQKGAREELLQDYRKTVISAF